MRYSKHYRHQHANGKSTWHFEWCTKYRYKVFNTLYNKNLCKIALQEAAKRSSVEILEMEVEPEHLHLVVEIPLTKTCVDAIRDLKSLSARILFRLMPKLRYKYPRKKLWSRGKFAISVGHITLEKAKEYVRNQETHHAKAYLRYIVGILARAVARVSPQAEGLPRGGCQIGLFVVSDNVQRRPG
ncbi:IS200/IS605 family transposase [Candidatus Woesearchaeota archaeon]|nr:IS200/IS605 family transposase [Candidatus Woesearchaeota archaeon]